LGNFKYEKNKLELGELGGNQFTITLRDCHFGDDFELDEDARVVLGNKVVSLAAEHLKTHGFINYFGLQRFGTFGIGTDEVGKRILRNDFKGAVDAILDVNAETAAIAQQPADSQSHNLNKIGRDDLDRARGIHIFKSGGNVHDALNVLPYKYSAERMIIGHLGPKRNANDYVGALLSINRNLKLMYVHAYQSLVWNVVTSERWARYGNKVIKGDLVYVDVQEGKSKEEHEEVDEDGEKVVRPDADDTAVTRDDLFLRGRPLTSEEAASGKYTIFDIILPLPGWDIVYPDNEIGEFYKEFMESERGGGLDPGDMRRSQKDFSLSGSYRKVMGEAKDLNFEIKTYREENEQLVETDVEKMKKLNPGSFPQNSDQRRDLSGQQNRGDSQRGRNSRGGRNQRGGRQNDFYTKNAREDRYRDIRVEDGGESRDKPQQSDTVNSRMNAWNSLPAKLATEDRVAHEAYQVERATKQPVNPADIKQPAYQETYIQTSAENEGKRTGHRVTSVVSDVNDGRVTTSTSQVETANSKPHASSSLSVVDESEDDDPQAGGVKLVTQMSPKKRAADEISTSLVTDSR
jgi:tRNA pseudouridine13 synthase